MISQGRYKPTQVKDQVRDRNDTDGYLVPNENGKPIAGHGRVRPFRAGVMGLSATKPTARGCGVHRSCGMLARCGRRLFGVAANLRR